MKVNHSGRKKTRRGQSKFSALRKDQKALSQSKMDGLAFGKKSSENPRVESI